MEGAGEVVEAKEAGAAIIRPADLCMPAAAESMPEAFMARREADRITAITPTIITTTIMTRITTVKTSIAPRRLAATINKRKQSR